MILTAGDNGAFELIDNRINSLVGKPLVGGFDGGTDMALFVEPTQEPQPTLVEFKPTATPAWSKRLFPTPGQPGH